MATTDWRLTPQNVVSTDGACDGVKWPALVFGSYQAANEWLIDVEHLRRLKPTTDVEDRVVFYFGRTSLSPNDTTQVALLPAKTLDATPWSADDDYSSEPMYRNAVELATQFANAPTKLKACEIVFNSSLDNGVVTDSQGLVSPGVHIADDEREWGLLFESIWEILEADGWSLLTCSGDLAYLMPGVSFLNFTPGVTVHTSKKAAFKKALDEYASAEASESSERVWSIIWDYMETHKQWKSFKMRNNDVMYHVPGINVMDLVPNVNFFMNKKDAVLKFTSERKSLVKKRKSPDGVEDAPLAAPSPPLVATAEPETTVAPTTTTTTTTTTTSALQPVARTKKTKKRALNESSDKENSDVNSRSSTSHRRRFADAEFPFARLYSVLKEFGWTYVASTFGYKYVAPGRDAKGVEGVDHFPNEEAVIEFLQAKGHLHAIQAHLRGGPMPQLDFNGSTVAQPLADKPVPAKPVEPKPIEVKPVEAKPKVVKPTKQRLSFSGVENTPVAPDAKKKTKSVVISAEDDDTSPIKTTTVAKKAVGKAKKSKATDGDATKPKKAAEADATKPKKTGRKAALTISTKAASKAKEAVAVSPPRRATGFKCSFGLVYRVLQSRGYTHKTGPMGYSYFKPGKTEANGELNVDYWHNEVDLELFLKRTGEWARISRILERSYNGYSTTESSPEATGAASEAGTPAPTSPVPRFNVPLSTAAAASGLFSPDRSNDADDEDMSVESSPEAKKTEVKKPVLTRAKTQPKATKKAAKSSVTIPPFEMKFGRLFSLLQKRGWRYKNGLLGYEYAEYKDRKELRSFHSEDDLIAYLKQSKQYAGLEKELQKEHRRRYIYESSTEGGSASEALVLPSTSEDETANGTYSFANIWPVLKARGWTERKPNTMEDSAYTYCNPRGKVYNKSGVVTYAKLVKVLDDTKEDDESDNSDSDSSSDDDSEVSDVDKQDDETEVVIHKTPSTKAIVFDTQTAPVVVDVVSSSSEEETTPTTTSTSTLTWQPPADEATQVLSSPVSSPAKSAASSPVSSPAKSAASSPAKSVASPEKGPSLLEQEVARVLENLSLAHRPDAMPHRAKQQKMLHDFVRRCVHQKQRGSAYVSGTPGTGKTALLRLMQEQIAKEWSSAHQATPLSVLNLNAMALSDSNGVFTTIARKVTKRSFSSTADAIAALEIAFQSTTTTTLLILDEIDVLLNGKGESDLYRLFEWAHHPSSSLIFIGIANSIDLTNKYIPYLRTRSCIPVVVMFRPYDYDAIHSILEARIVRDSLLPKALFDPVALSFLSRKIAQLNGDIRTAFDICRRVLNQKAEKESGTKSFAVSLMEMSATLKLVVDFQGSKVLQTLPRNTQFIVYATTKMQPRVANVFSIHETYDKFCELSRMAGTSAAAIMTLREFYTQLDTLASQNLLTLNQKKESFRLFMTKEENEKSLGVDPYFKALLRQSSMSP
ncbi:hypothetical protein SPRG_05888 [Saprolegnia parasitica CBS 223.65]|uniref:AAA+ ATPase domain-containing protein n=1 Tax=Saprolegnia parasitica (strain CBS 223.65) TaxID=695850 RepID=A0A067CRB4_SAPPC|nr:hypothetical protein SPRG_05888 [Saprolegnia parasitica CBS 223.65]KDO29352.1 hypothetical protein SPRG_05888 [Saprolegnia parasitica CBS 223.65]|eukprot:XP_012199855.1 hypothetical protein SPRG_05888 [Saprolegnia parasitica CBS 223.65]